jgi:hypothetical protein
LGKSIICFSVSVGLGEHVLEVFTPPPATRRNPATKVRDSNYLGFLRRDLISEGLFPDIPSDFLGFLVASVPFGSPPDFYDPIPFNRNDEP